MTEQTKTLHERATELALDRIKHRRIPVRYLGKRMTEEQILHNMTIDVKKNLKGKRVR